MTLGSRRVREVIDAGETDDVNALIDEIEGLDRSEAADVLDDVYECCLELYKSGDHDGYQRQSIVRVLDAFVPTLGFPLDELGVDDRASRPAGDEDASRTRAHLYEFCLETITDDDGRVRTATIGLLQPLSVGAQYAGAEAELEALVDELENHAAETSGDVADDIRKARDAVAPRGFSV